MCLEKILMAVVIRSAAIEYYCMYIFYRFSNGMSHEAYLLHLVIFLMLALSLILNVHLANHTLDGKL